MPSSNQSPHHSIAFPAMSSAPYGDAPSGKLPTGAVYAKPSLVGSFPPGGPGSGHEASRMLALPGSHSLPHGHSRQSVPRAAFSHSASDGRTTLAHWQKAWASSQLTLTTGCSSVMGQSGLDGST